MHRLSYAGDSVYVADDVCSALMDYAGALAEAQTADVVTIPIIDEAGLQTEAEILVGPASQLFSTRVEHMREDAQDPETVADLRDRTAKLRESRGGSAQSVLS